MTANAQYLLALVAAVFVILAGALLVTTTVAGELASFGWLLVVIGVLSVAANVSIRAHRR
jgi:hypothetical protein